MRKLLTAAALIAPMCTALTVNAQSLAGSDTLEAITAGLIASNCGGAAPPPSPANLFAGYAGGPMTYGGGGSGTGQNALVGATQIVAPMSRAVNAGGCTSLGTRAATTAGVAFALDALVMVGNSVASETCGGTHTVHSAGVEAGPSYSDLADAGGATGWRNVLRLLYAGAAPSLPANYSDTSCNHATRRTLAANYANLFQGGCAGGACNGQKIKHVFRRGDLSGTTDTFISLLGLPANTIVGTGVNAVVTATSFCNGLDQEDNDPIRVDCEDGDQVCNFDGTLGLVLPVLVPTVTNDPSRLYNAGLANDAAGEGAFRTPGNSQPSCITGVNLDMTRRAYGLPPGTQAANATLLDRYLAAVVTGCVATRVDCRYPVPSCFALGTFEGQSTAADRRWNWNLPVSSVAQIPFHPAALGGVDRSGVLNGRTELDAENSPPGWGAKRNQAGVVRCCNVNELANGALGLTVGQRFRRMDVRVQNLALRRPVTSAAGAAGTYEGPTPTSRFVGDPDVSRRPSNVGAYYRLASSTRGYTVVGVANDAANVPVCQLPDSTEQIGCLVQKADDCSVGFAGGGAAYAGSPNAPLAEPFALKPTDGPNCGDPTVACTQNLVTDFANAYPFARFLFLNTDDDTRASLTGGFVANAPDFATAQANLWKCMRDKPFTGTALDAGFFPLPAHACNGNTAGKPCKCDNMCTSNPTCSTLSTF